MDVERSFISVDTRVALAAEFGLHVSAEDRAVIADARAKWRDLQVRTPPSPPVLTGHVSSLAPY